MKLLQNAASKKAMLEGSVLCIDPSSGGTSRKGENSEAGYAIFQAGELVESGTIKFPPNKEVFKRIRKVRELVEKQFPQHFDLLVLEEIKGHKAQSSLIQACGAYICSIKSGEFFELNVSCWKAIARHWGGYSKSDEQDAIYLGYCTLAIACGWKSSLKVAGRDEVIEKAKSICFRNAAPSHTKFKKRKTNKSKK